MQTVICYRNIGYEEFIKLISGETIFGRYKNSTEKQNNATQDNVICCFQDKIMWKDNDHCILLLLEVPLNQIVECGKGMYWNSKNFAKTHIMSGRRGKTQYYLNEYYLSQYSLANVKAFVSDSKYGPASYLVNRFNADFARDKVVQLRNWNIPVIPWGAAFEPDSHYVEQWFAAVNNFIV